MARSKGLFERGLKVRRKVLGREHVDRSFRSADEFTRDLQDYVTEHAWGAVWVRPGLDLRSRSLITVSILAALGIEAELRLHVAAALRNGCVPREIKEALLQVAVYAGAPRAVDAFRVATPVVEQADATTIS